jgi:urease accessory protein
MTVSMRRITVSTWQPCLTLLLLSVGSEVHAHSSVKGVGDFYAGVLHPLTSLENILPFVGLGLLIGQQAKRAQETVLIFSVALMVGALVSLALPAHPLVSVANLFSAALFGALVAAAVSLPKSVYWTLGLVFGLTHGFANGEGVSGNVRWYLFIPGVGMAGFLVTMNLMFITDYLVQRKQTWIPIAVRVAGSWLTAVGILVLAATGKALFKA